MLYIAAGAMAVLVLGALVAGAIYQYILVPRESYASVNGVDIRRTDYVKYRKYTLLQELAGIQGQLQTAQEDQRPQLEDRITQLQLEYQDLENGDKNINPDALNEMVNDQIVMQSLDDFGITISEQEVDDFVTELLSPIPLTEPTPSPTVEPTAAAWATQTTEAFGEQATATGQAMATQLAQTPEATAGEGTAPPEGTETEATPETPGTAGAEETASDEATPEATEPGAESTEAEGTPALDGTAEADATAAQTEEPTATLSEDQARETAESNFELLDENFLEAADMSRDDFERLIARPQLARVKISEQLAADIGPRADQVRASHILVATEEAAVELLNGRLQNEEFADVAREVSTDTASAENGGDLGWFPRGVMTEPFEEAAFSQEVGVLPEEPVQTQFGWHIILVQERQDDRPLTVSMLNNLKSGAFNQWLSEQREKADIEAEVTLPVDEQQPNITGG
jgi:parvulin-like peptidyl-prolyl isomerase